MEGAINCRMTSLKVPRGLGSHASKGVRCPNLILKFMVTK